MPEWILISSTSVVKNIIVALPKVYIEDVSLVLPLRRKLFAAMLTSVLMVVLYRGGYRKDRAELGTFGIFEFFQ